MMMSTSGHFFDQTIDKSASRPKVDKIVESASEVDFGNSRSVSPIQEKLNRTSLPVKEAQDLINKAPPAAGLKIQEIQTESTAKVETKPIIVTNLDPVQKTSTEVKKTEVKQTEVKQPEVKKEETKTVEIKQPPVVKKPEIKKLDIKDVNPIISKNKNPTEVSEYDSEESEEESGSMQTSSVPTSKM